MYKSLGLMLAVTLVACGPDGGTELLRRSGAPPSTPAEAAGQQPGAPSAAPAEAGGSKRDGISALATTSTCTLQHGAIQSVQLQACIDRAPAGSILELPAGVFYVDRTILLTKPLTIRTANTDGWGENCKANSGRCAVLAAATDLYGYVLSVESTSDVHLEHIMLHGNRAVRVNSRADLACPLDGHPGMNARMSGCERCSMVSSASIETLCGSGMEWVGDDAYIVNNYIGDNGRADLNTVYRVSDGLTLFRSDRATVAYNTFSNNSDVAFISGRARGADIHHNYISQTTQRVFAALMLDNFNTSDIAALGDFTGLDLHDNTIDCSTNFLCDFGIEIGPQPWYPSAHIAGGAVHNNYVGWALQSINVAGAGVPGNPLSLYDNAIYRPATGLTRPFSGGCTPSFSLQNISPDSAPYVIRTRPNGVEDTTPTTNSSWDYLPNGAWFTCY